MPLYIKDEDVNRLADELTVLTKSSKTEAVRNALKIAIASRKTNLPIREKLAKSFAMTKEFGPYAAGDHKAEANEMWSEDYASHRRFRHRRHSRRRGRC